MRPFSGFAVVLTLSSFGGAVVSAACSSDPDPAPAGPAQAGDAVDGGAPVDTGEGGTATLCAATASYIECRLCCNEPPSYRESQNAFNDCMCEACKDLCATTACSQDADAGEPSPGCLACLTDDAKGQACFPKADAICDEAPDCNAYRECLSGADCRGKPDF